jgi:4-hydroxy-tetrahydrodipicolinate synthase
VKVECGVRDTQHAFEVDLAQAHVEKVRSISNRFAQISAIKAMLARRDGNDDWLHMRPPLRPLTEEQRREIATAMTAAGA